MREINLDRTYPFKSVGIDTSACRSWTLSQVGELFGTNELREDNLCSPIITMGPKACGHTVFQYAVMAEPAATVAVSWSAPEVPSSLHAIVGSVASVIGLLRVYYVK